MVNLGCRAGTHQQKQSDVFQRFHGQLLNSSPSDSQPRASRLGQQNKCHKKTKSFQNLNFMNPT
ncbi:hypothetical protein EBR21_05690 [bacterium]|nr:hypothetical protein [bacterium]